VIPNAAGAGTWVLGERRVNRLGLGAMRLTGSAAFHQGAPRERSQAIATLRRAVDLGVNHLDTAAFYFSATGSANELIRSALSPYPEGLVIATKVGPGRDPSGEWRDPARPDQLRGQVEENLRQLGAERLEVVNLRVQGPGPVAERVGALADLVGAGLVGHLGVSGVTLDQLAEAQSVAPVVCVQNRLSVEHRTGPGAEVFAACAAQGIAFVPFFSVVGAGAHGTVPADQPDAVREVAERHGATAAQVRLAWTLALGENVLAIPGTGDPRHLEENVAAGALRLSDDDVARLGALAG
jgi:pyridoxine 4-dehydrogenase